MGRQNHFNDGNTFKFQTSKQQQPTQNKSNTNNNQKDFPRDILLFIFHKC